jgi:hypothetical protein
MGKFITAKFETTCIQTKRHIKVGDRILYNPGRGSLCEQAPLYKKQMNDAIEANSNLSNGEHGPE